MLIFVCSGVFTFSAVGLVLFRLGLELAPVIAFASLSGLLVSAFFYRERSLVLRFRNSEQAQMDGLSMLHARVENLYVESVACLVEFDPGTLIIERASFGFYDLFGLEPDVILIGTPLEDVLGVDSTHLEVLVERIINGTLDVEEELSSSRPNGDTMKLQTSGIYLKEKRMIELALSHLPADGTMSRELEQMQGDLERFRQGMLRRESRILELKGEVNNLLTDSGASARYKVDDKTTDQQIHAIKPMESGHQP